MTKEDLLAKVTKTTGFEAKFYDLRENVLVIHKGLANIPIAYTQDDLDNFDLFAERVLLPAAKALADFLKAA